ncbi:MAG: DUF111 family protein, partial [Bacteroidetes bacterium]|nr:DUF111 family protein [Bacteroidota bacterium]
MRIAYFDTVSGISGDMTLAACVSAGVPFDTLERELRKLPLDGYRLTMRTVTRSMISAVKIDVILDSQQAERKQHTKDPHIPDVGEQDEHTHTHKGHTHEGHTHEGHTHEGHTHEGHTHEGHTHEGHTHEGHTHEGH